MQRLDREDRVETGIKPNASVRNDGVLELRGGSRVNEGAGYVWEEGTQVDIPCVVWRTEVRQSQYSVVPHLVL